MLEYTPNSSIKIQTDSEVWRVAWNATGTVLTTSSQGSLGLWRRDFTGNWINVQKIESGEEEMAYLT